jgi:hypothetical protein
MRYAMATRRSFLSGTGITGAGLLVAAFREDALTRAAGAGKEAGKTPACELAANEDYWAEIQRCFDTDRTIINLNNGGVCPTPTHVLDQMIRDLRFTNESRRTTCGRSSSRESSRCAGTSPGRLVATPKRWPSPAMPVKRWRP